MTILPRFMQRKNRNHHNNGGPSPDERQREFLREHEARMRRVDEALAEARRGAQQQQQREARGV